jgi:hypothetical protein
MNTKRTVKMLGFFIVVFQISCILINVQAAYSPSSNELAPTKDAYIYCLDSIFYNTTTPYGQSTDLDLGQYTVVIIQFDLTNVPTDIDQLNFTCDYDMNIFESGAPKIAFSYLLTSDWDETTISGANAPYNLASFAGLTVGSITTLTVNSETSTLKVDLIAFKAHKGIFNLIITSDKLGTIKARESSNAKAHIVFSSQAIRDADNMTTGIIVIAVVAIIVICVVIKKKKN